MAHIVGICRYATITVAGGRHQARRERHLHPRSVDIRIEIVANVDPWTPEMSQPTSPSPSAPASKATVVKQRVIIGTILLAAIIGLFWADAQLSRLAPGAAAGVAVNWRRLLLHGGLVTCVAAAAVVAGTAEMVALCRSAGMRPLAGWSMLMSLLLTIHPWAAKNIHGLTADRLALWLLVVALAGSVLGVMIRRQTEGAIQDIASTWFSAVYMGLLASFAVRMRQEVAGPAGAWLVLYFIAMVKFTDIFAYATGMLVGRHKLIPWLSPGKTIEGLIGGLTGAALISMLLAYGSVIIMTDKIQHPVGPEVYVWVGLLGALLGGIGQLGDLMESLLKRGAKQKDSARLLPGFGGVFDLLDSPLLAAPVAWAVFPWTLAALLR
jgi:phosphatidate cytidylyltransferase